MVDLRLEIGIIPASASRTGVGGVVLQCANRVTPKWRSRLAGYDVYIWHPCYAMEQSLLID